MPTSSGAELAGGPESVATTEDARPLALTCGDPAGIGPDIAIGAWLRRSSHDIPPFAVIGDAGVIAARATLLGVSAPVREIADAAEAPAVFAEAIPVLQCPLAEPVTPGQPSPENAAGVIAAIDRAVALVITGECAAVVTNPIAKEVLYAAGFAHPGHTEYLGALARAAVPGFAGEPVMLLASEVLNVVPLTIHVPLRDVPDLVSGELIVRTTRTLAAAMRRDLGISAPRIIVAGLNPHAGEGGTIGTEDRDVIAPAIAILRAEGIDIVGPVSADTMFHAEARAAYDVALTMYHDQGLIPIKTLAFDSGVNVTLGLPFVRTSPDHGTAFAIAGSGKASPSSLVAALRMAAAMATQRRASDAAG